MGGPGEASCVPFPSLSIHPLPSTILLCSAHPVVLCALQMPVNSLQSHQHLFSGNTQKDVRHPSPGKLEKKQ